MRRQYRRGFSLIELLIVVAVIAILAALLFPVLSAARAKGQQTACMNNLRQLVACWLVYADDNGSKYADNLPLVDLPAISNNWALGNMQIQLQSTNVGFLERGELFPYTIQPSLYHCPVDPSLTGGRLHVRSYAMNSWIGNSYMLKGFQGVLAFQQEDTFRTFVTENDTVFMGTSALWVFADEDQTVINDPWWLVTMDNSQPFEDFPANRHTHGYNLSFADGHAERWPLRDPSTTLGLYLKIQPANSDWIRLKRATTISTLR
jgi:prepilin-type N-terminal cleavage/methylation domain-containing protein/prepilin-type processing-associated H-X9-DG protein